MKKRLTQQSRAIPRKRSQIEIKFEGNWSWGLVQERAEGGKEKGGILPCPEGTVLLNYVSLWKLSSVRMWYTAVTHVPECDDTHNPDLREKIYVPLYFQLNQN
jgi:hypothetical protein